MYVIQKGTVAVRKMKGNGYVDIAKVHSSEVLGELAFFDREPRSAAAIALTEVEALEIRFDALEKIYDTIPNYFKVILACVAERLRRSNDTIKRLQKNLVTAQEGVVNREGGGATTGTDPDAPSTASVLADLENPNPLPSESADEDPTRQK